MKKLSSDELASHLHRALRALPPPQAPHTLEARVLAALERQAAIPWYHRSWAYWPATWRSLFLVLATGVAGGVLVGSSLLAQGFDASEWLTRPGFVGQCYEVVRWLAEQTMQAADRVPRLWVWSALAIFMTLNAVFFGLGAVAYRTLFRRN